MTNNGSRATAKDRLKEDTKQRIIQSGIKAFAEYGFYGMKIAAVARRADVANGTFYLHFKDKTELYEEIMRSAGAKLASAIFSARNYHASSGNADRSEIEAIIQFASDNKDLMKIALDNSAPVKKRSSSLFKPLIDMRVDEVKQGIKQGHINNAIHPEVAVRAELGMMLAAVQWWVEDKGGINKEELISTLAHIKRSWASTGTDVDDIDKMLSQWDSRL